jgi:hypothetical protein
MVACPKCGGQPQSAATLGETLGFRLFEREEAPPVLPEALAVSLPVPYITRNDGAIQ